MGLEPDIKNKLNKINKIALHPHTHVRKQPGM